jgi:hypothetical protein
VGLHEVVNREVILSIVEPRAAPDDLFELDHRIHPSQEDDVPDIARVHSR